MGIYVFNNKNFSKRLQSYENKQKARKKKMLKLLKKQKRKTYS